MLKEKVSKEVVEKFNNKKDGSILHYHYKTYFHNDFFIFPKNSPPEHEPSPEEWDEFYNEQLLFVKNCIDNGANINALNNKKEELFYIICNTFQYSFTEDVLSIIQILFQNGLVPSEKEIDYALENCCADEVGDLIKIIIEDLKMNNDAKFNIIKENIYYKCDEAIKLAQKDHGSKFQIEELINEIQCQIIGIVEYLESGMQETNAND